MLRNRRIGCSVSGVAQFVTNRGIDEFQQWLNNGYDVIQTWDKSYSDWMAVPRSIKTTSVKPSGTVSLLLVLHQDFTILNQDFILEELGYQNTQNY